MVDHEPPRLNVTSIYDVEILNSIREQLKYKFNSAVHMVKALHEVNVLPGKTETFNFNYGIPRTTNYYERRDRIKRIEERNLHFSKVIQNTVRGIDYFAEGNVRTLTRTSRNDR